MLRPQDEHPQVLYLASTLHLGMCHRWEEVRLTAPELEALWRSSLVVDEHEADEYRSQIVEITKRILREIALVQHWHGDEFAQTYAAASLADVDRGTIGSEFILRDAETIRGYQTPELPFYFELPTVHPERRDQKDRKLFQNVVSHAIKLNEIPAEFRTEPQPLKLPPIFERIAIDAFDFAAHEFENVFFDYSPHHSSILYMLHHAMHLPGMETLCELRPYVAASAWSRYVFCLIEHLRGDDVIPRGGQEPHPALERWRSVAAHSIADLYVRLRVLGYEQPVA